MFFQGGKNFLRNFASCQVRRFLEGFLGRICRKLMEDKTMKNKIWKMIALTCITASVLAGCNSADGTKGSESEKQEVESSGMADDTEKEEASSSEEGLKAHNASMDWEGVDPMELTDSWQRAAYFADWVYYEGKGENTLVSPLSLNLAMGLAAEGASGQTAKEIYQYLGREDYADYVQNYMEFAEGLTAEPGSVPYSDKYSFRYEIANSIWINQKNRIQADYRKSMEEKFRAEVEPADFEGNISDAVYKINSWCKGKTHGLIEKIVEESNIQPNTKAILINSLYFESPWVDPWLLAEHDFTNFDGKTTTQEMLRGGADSYYENDQAIAFGKNYYNGFQFIGILPKTEGEFSILNLDLESLVKSGSQDYEVSAVMPKLDFSTSAEKVEDVLKSQGIVTPFNVDNAQFDKIIEGESLFISQIIQKCKIELDENGTKAAAVTAIILRTSGIMPVAKESREVILDRPFAFMIYDTVNDEIVFVGKVTNVQ